MLDFKECKKNVLSISLSYPTLQDNRADADRLLDALKNTLNADHIGADLHLLRTISGVLRKSGYRVRCVLFKDRGKWILTGVMEADSPDKIAGIAVDLGTTRIVLRAVDLETGEELGETSFDNPQIAVGPDVLTRIHHAGKEGGGKELRDLAVSGMNKNIEALCASCGIATSNIYTMAVAGNTAMAHLFMGLDPKWLIREPYIPVVNVPDVIRASELGLKLNRGARAFIFPNIGSYFGGDLIAGILYSGMSLRDEISILVDVGTNAEVVLGNSNWLIACAGAAGPALEGGVSRMGMMAGPGVIDRVAIDPATLEIDVHTIGDQMPRGICGSGLIDLAAQLFLSRMIDISGKFIPSRCGDKLKLVEGIQHLVLVPKEKSASEADLTLSQVDLNSLISSKAAMYTILEVLTDSVGLSPEDLQRFFVAGTFGCFIDPVAAISIGMLPDIPVKNYEPLGNSSLGGASMALKSADIIEKVDRIRKSITYIELNVNQEFMNRFSGAKFFPHTDSSRFPSVRVRA